MPHHGRVTRPVALALATLLLAGPAAPPSAPTLLAPIATGAALVPVPVVPVVGIRSGLSRVLRSDVTAALDGGGRWTGLALVAADADGILARLGAAAPADPARLVLVPDVASLARDLREHPGRLGFVRAGSVGPSLRALAWGRASLFGVERVRDLAAWPLLALLPPDPVAFDPAGLWTMWAGGDLGLDRGVAYAVKTLGKGVDFPFAGGTARIVGSTCCSAYGWPVPTIRAASDGGLVRRLISSADLAMANLETPAPDRWTFHASGTRFTGDPALLDGIARAGIDVVGLANNHIGDAGGAGILQTMRNLGSRGIGHVGAGATLSAARRAFVRTVGGVRVAILAYDGIAPYYNATATSPGSAPLRSAYYRADIAAARAAGAELVVVWPHWGIEYTRGPSAAQRSAAHAMVDAGADLVIGNHPHWVGAVETYRGRPIWYALGNFTFDQRWSEPTLLGISLELTFRGATLVQATMRPHVNVLACQPNLLDPARDGRRVLDPVFAASAGLLDW